MLLYFIPRQKSNPPRFRVYLCGNDRDIFIFVTDTENLCTLPDLVYTFQTTYSWSMQRIAGINNHVFYPDTYFAYERHILNRISDTGLQRQMG